MINMTKRILKDFYLRKGEAFRRAWRHSWITIVMTITAQSCIFADRENTGTCWIYSSVLLFFTLLLHTMYPGKMPEMMYLIPTDRKERENYLSHVFGVKVVGILLVQIVAESILVFSDTWSWWQSILHITSATVWSGVLGVTIQPQRMTEPLVIHGKEGIRIMIIHVLSWLFWLYLSFTDIKTAKSWVIILLLIIYFIQMIMGISLIKKRFPTMLEQGTDYEKIAEVRK